MKVLNIHGYHGVAKNTAYTVAKKYCDVKTLQIDYDNEDEEDILYRITEIVKSFCPHYIVGTSLGGFYASIIASRYNIPVVLVNPCLMPFIQLPRLGYKRSLLPLVQLFGEISKLDEKMTTIIIGGKDEIVDTHDVTMNMFRNVTYYIYPEGLHSGSTLPLDEYFSKIFK